MFRKYVYHDITWYDFKNPRVEEFLDVAHNYEFDKSIIKKFITTQQNTEAFVHGDIIFLSLFFPCNLNEEKKSIQKKQVRFIIGKDYIFTARAEDIRGFYDLKKKIKVSKTSPLNPQPNPTAPLTELLQEVYRHIGDDLEALSKSLSYAERHILNQKDISKNAVYQINKKTQDLHNILETQETVWKVFDGLCKEFFEDIYTDDTLSLVMSDYEKTLEKSNENKSKKIDQKLLKTQSITRKNRIVKLQRFAFWIIFFTLLVVGAKVI